MRETRVSTASVAVTIAAAAAAAATHITITTLLLLLLLLLQAIYVIIASSSGARRMLDHRIEPLMHASHSHAHCTSRGAVRGEVLALALPVGL